MTLVFDATPLIYLATVERLGVLGAFDTDRVVPRAVYEEVVTRGIEADHPDARRIERHVEDGVLDVLRADRDAFFETVERNEALSEADVAVLALARQHDGTAVMDERAGRDAAAVEGVPTRGTASLLLALVRDGDLDPDAARETIDGMVDAGWYCSPYLYARIVRTIESLS